MFVARPPEDIFAMTESKMSEAKKSLSTLSSLGAKSRSEIQTLYFEGTQGIKEALHYKIDTCREKELVGFYATAENIPDETMRVLNKYNESLVKAGIKIKGFTPEDETTKIYRSGNNPYQEVRGLPKQFYSSKISIDTQDDYVRILDMHRLQAVIMENPYVAKTIKEIFEILWETDPFKK